MESKRIEVSFKDRKRASWIREQIRAKDTLVEIKRKDWSWAEHAVRRSYDRSANERITEWLPRDRTRCSRRPITRWRDQIGMFGGERYIWSLEDRRRCSNLLGNRSFCKGGWYHVDDD